MYRGEVTDRTNFDVYWSGKTQANMYPRLSEYIVEANRKCSSSTICCSASVLTCSRHRQTKPLLFNCPQVCPRNHHLPTLNQYPWGKLQTEALLHCICRRSDVRVVFIHVRVSYIEHMDFASQIKGVNLIVVVDLHSSQGEES